MLLDMKAAHPVSLDTYKGWRGLHVQRHSSILQTSAWFHRQGL